MHGKRRQLTMSKTSIFFTIILLTSGVGYFLPAFSDDDLLDQLRSTILARTEISGNFFQCVKQGSARFISSGHYEIIPDHQLSLNFELPKNNTVIYYSNGTYIDSNLAVKNDSPKFSAITKVIFSMVNLEKSSLERLFDIKVDGSIDRFTIYLTPKRRLGRVLKKVQILGLNKQVQFIHFYTKDNREISMVFNNDKETLSHCE